MVSSPTRQQQVNRERFTQDAEIAGKLPRLRCPVAAVPRKETRGARTLPAAPEIRGHGRDAPQPLPFQERRAEGPPPAGIALPRARQGPRQGRGTEAVGRRCPGTPGPARGPSRPRSSVRGGPFVRGRPGLPAPAPGRGYGGSRPREAPQAAGGGSATEPGPTRPRSPPSPLSSHHSPSSPQPPPPLPRLPGRGVETRRTDVRTHRA